MYVNLDVPQRTKYPRTLLLCSAKTISGQVKTPPAIYRQQPLLLGKKKLFLLIDLSHQERPALLLFNAQGEKRATKRYRIYS
ncbi:hypothetical protein LJC09_04155 [Desulfovibrio sp. OttesenSCG-928-F20]|nr:hypothetical protein [Desulfovibrio sp. OttesenSCG-928-F20]